MSSILEGKLTARIREHVRGIDLRSLSRIDEKRLASKAMNHIGSVELITSEAFAELYNPLYVNSFPKREERENPDLIIERLAKQDSGERSGCAPYRLIGIRDCLGAPIGAAHISALPLPGGQFAVPYLQYIYVREENRRQDMSEVMHTLVLAVAAADAAKDNRTVPFTFFETEMRGQGDDEESRKFSHSRTEIHDKSGGMALMLIRDGEELSAHVQPGLEEGDPPITLVWVIRPSPTPGRPYDIQALARDLIAAYYQSLRDEGFPEQNIRMAEEIVQGRCKGGAFCLVPLSQVGTYQDPRKPVGSTAATAFAEL
jgi:hypothetical protein